MTDIILRFFKIHPAKIVSDRYPLVQLAQFETCKDVNQFRLTGQYYLYQLVSYRLEIGYQPDLFEHIPFEILRFIDYQHDGVSLRVLPQEEPVQLIEEFLVAEIFAGNSEFPVYALHKAGGRQAGIEDEGRAVIFSFKLVEQCS